MRYLSLFSGVEAATLAWEELGWEAVAFAQFDPDHDYSRGPDFASAVLDFHWPNVPNLGDVTKITTRTLKQLGQIDLVVFGSPCQGLSIAGKGDGLNDERSGLFKEAIRIVNLCKKHCGTRFALWENVPGSFSTNGGSDFSEVIKLLSGSKFDCEKWQTSGLAIGEKGLVEWATLNAQYFGVPQRRRRVFAFADFGDWENRREVLFNSQSVPRDLESSRAAQKKTSRGIANGIGNPSHWDNRLAPHPTLSQSHSTGGIAQSNQELFSQRGAGLVMSIHQNNRGEVRLSKVAPTLQTSGGTVGQGYQAVTFKKLNSANSSIYNESGFGLWKEGIGPLRSSGGTVGGGSENLTINKPACFNELAYCLQTTCNDYSRADGFNMVIHGTQDPIVSSSAHCLGRNSGQENALLNLNGRVRKLTPIECERLQGMPDDHTKVPWMNKSTHNCPDGHRYKAIGNSMAVPVMKWIGQQIQLATQ
ncbi:DNA-cytosine methyltransferase [Pseudoalteromonas luteoviolacea CPMOR-1]|uniref:Cytosine-specific methyltransferase n=1 Tax=Pseudoalteromonas luteoviolacea CPMOR-1 TaxID=1365248 RepID=A0A167KCZ4_9GAMM|nr:DNA (cytosine-5-)-methyltransferase [Pseudoalteromonas luteoviolacea]KZN62611.1 DNA-cytosine methyltransferase [Pseudoalteromonas luteoviolacea CPMOR-1]